MKTIKVLGSGCKKCIRTEELIRKEIKAANLEITVSKVTQPEEIMRYQVLSTPAVVVDEKVVHSGSIPEPGKIRQWLQ
ncbi:MAG: thioredoxin family protein [SAR324 cluster bacterium]|nr:thioredoxin family protein [SAR324 cluster bacterium]